MEMTAQHITKDWLLNAPKLDWRLWAQPNHVVTDPSMALSEKRALLASWASDARAVPNYPALRQLDSGHLITIDSVLAALKRLDETTDNSDRPNRQTHRQTATSRKGHWSRISRLWRRRSSFDDDDDGPSSPAPAGIIPPLPVLDGAAAAKHLGRARTVCAGLADPRTAL